MYLKSSMNGRILKTARSLCVLSRQIKCWPFGCSERTTRETIDIARVYDCGGVSVDVQSSSNPVIRELVANGRARPDELHIGLDVDEYCAVIDAGGKATDRLLVIGPLTRGRFFEIEAIPDIRVQAANLAARILAKS